MKNQTTTQAEPLKVAWIRDPNVPAGQPARGRLNCACGNAPETDFTPRTEMVFCGCGRVYTWNGWRRKDHELKIVKVCFADPALDYVTNVNGQVSDAEIAAYFVGTRFDHGVFPVEDFHVCIRIEISPDLVVREPTPFHR